STETRQAVCVFLDICVSVFTKRAHGIGHPDQCCFQYTTVKIPPKQIDKVEKTSLQCPIVGTIPNVSICRLFSLKSLCYLFQLCVNQQLLITDLLKALFVIILGTLFLSIPLT
uniref:Chemokine interleukin-8-like domain-containing protein n=1 Tax=Astyanax mexicanus TaxID=7994 RepID=A0A8B9JYT4_ASTMX